MKSSSDYMSVHAWLKSFVKMPLMHGHCVACYQDEIPSYIKTLDDVLTIVAVMLSYNCLYFKESKVDAGKRRTALKELRRKITAKLGKYMDISSSISDRLQAAVSGK